jgi:hypothetical protein
VNGIGMSVLIVALLLAVAAVMVLSLVGSW